MASLATISNSASTTLPTVNFRPHGHKKGLQLESQSGSSSNSLGQLPVGATQNLFSSLLQSLQQVIGAPTTTAATAATTATTATTGASTTASTVPATSTTSPVVAQDLNGFLHSLFQVLKQDGLGDGASAGTTAAAASTGTSGAPAVTGASQYQGSLVSSLQTLIQQVGSSGSTSPAISNLDASFNNLVQGLNTNSASASTSAAGGTASTQSSNAALQNFLNNLLQNLQANGLQAPKLTGSSVNANV